MNFYEFVLKMVDEHWIMTLLLSCIWGVAVVASFECLGKLRLVSIWQTPKDKSCPSTPRQE